MNKDPEIELEIQAWVDGELGPEAERRIAERVQSDPRLCQLADNLRAVTHALRQDAPAPAVPVSREFYWSGIRRGIEQASPQRTVESPASDGARLPFSRWLAWLIPTAAVALAVALLLPSGNPAGNSAPISRQALTDHVVETPSDEISSLTFYAAQDSMTIVWLGRIDFL